MSYLEIKKVKLNELSAFINSDFFKNTAHLPISTLRNISYQNNPNALPNDVVLYVGFLNGEIVCYRTVWRDMISKKTFGWLSGNWVCPNHRRRGFSTQLFKEVYHDWGGKLMFTNYAPASKLVYDKTHQFERLYSLNGYRFYRKMSLSKLLPQKHSFFKQHSDKLQWFDAKFNQVWFQKNVKTKNASFETVSQLSDSDKIFLEKQLQNHCFRRDLNTFDWILKHPWVTQSEQEKTENMRYHFTVWQDDFTTNLYRFKDNNKNTIGLLWINIRNGNMKFPYSFISQVNPSEWIALIHNIITTKDVEMVTVYDSTLITFLRQKPFSFLTKKKFTQNYFITRKLKAQLPENFHPKIMTGDGDGVFV